MKLDRSWFDGNFRKPANKKEWIPVKGDSGNFPELRNAGTDLPFKQYLMVIFPVNEVDICNPHWGLIPSTLASVRLFLKDVHVGSYLVSTL